MELLAPRVRKVSLGISSLTAAIHPRILRMDRPLIAVGLE
jgi:hypothetical protein